jgi:8-oxo-dGTP pyrophosphatase MutT (NUDIX family)
MSENINPWQILENKEIYENPWILVTEFQVINPSGGKGIYGRVHFKNTAVGIVPIDEDGFTWLIGQYRFPLNQYSWEIPEGGGGSGENPLDAAKRELVEETGLIAREWSEILTMYLSNSVTDEKAIIYLARGLEQRISSPEETEKLAVRKLHFDEAFTMVERGEVTDAMSVAAFQKLHIMRLKNEIKL